MHLLHEEDGEYRDDDDDDDHDQMITMNDGNGNLGRAIVRMKMVTTEDHI